MFGLGFRVGAVLPRCGWLVTSAVVAGLVLGACSQDKQAAAPLFPASPSSSVSSPTANASAKPYASKYPGIKITGPVLTPEQTEVVDAMAAFEFAFKGMMEKLPSSFDSLGEFTTPEGVELAEKFVRDSHRRGFVSKGWSKERLFKVQLFSSSAEIISCSDSRQWIRENSDTIEKGLRMEVRYSSFVKQKGKWVLSLDRREPAYNSSYSKECL